MTVLVLNHRPLSRRPIGRWLQEAGQLVMVTTRSAMTASPADERALFSAIVSVEDYISGSVQRAAWRLAKVWEPARVASNCEYDLIRTAVLRELRGIEGQRIVSAVAYRDKLRMRETALAAGLRIPGFGTARTPEDVARFADTRGFPLVIKPRLGTGAAGINVAWAMRDLAGIVAQGWPRGQLVEEYVDAPLYHLDGMALAGEVVHCWPSRYSGAALEDIARGGLRTSVQLGAEDPLRPVLQAFAARVIAAFPAGAAGFGFHLEAWVPEDGIPVLCEVASRAAAEVIVAAYQQAFGVNLFEESFRAQAGLPLHLTRQPSRPGCYAGWICFLTEKGVFVPPPGEGMPPAASFETVLEPGTHCDRARTVTDVAARAVVEGSCTDETEGQLHDLIAWWSASRPWR